ncbi:response regulator [Methyloligella sp. 2.7D]|uniref:response regulator n=1 Tax=unclassified Methyloligella TaxID=2625955 RepID=UPI00157C1057|nr:response regulator [Methyloligella sp. GL2]QKP76513.1 response regulator [Methyloligella sp. GL2]
MRSGELRPGPHRGGSGERTDSISALSKALDEERKKRAKAEESDRAKSELLALVSHELRTPMGAVLAMSELLLAGPLESTQRRYAETLQQSARGLLSVLNEILDFSKLEAGRFDLDPAPFDLRELLRDITAGLEVRAERKGLRSGSEVAAAVPRYVYGDAGRLRQILTNLSDNAVKFTEHGSVRLEADAVRGAERTSVTIAIADTGVGLSATDRARLFEPYVQIDRKVAAEYGGTGLGLFIARKLAELMDGEIGCESIPGKGSRFWVTLPLQLADPAAVRPEEEAEPEGGLKGTVLVVEDNAVNRMLIGAYLDEFGVRHEMAAGGEEALRLLAAKPVDLVLMDIMMPELDGIETTRRIRALPGPVSEVPVVALTANAMQGDKEHYLAAGMNGYVAKPIHGRELYEEVAAYLEPASAKTGALR